MPQSRNRRPARLRTHGRRCTTVVTRRRRRRPAPQGGINPSPPTWRRAPPHLSLGAPVRPPHPQLGRPRSSPSEAPRFHACHRKHYVRHAVSAYRRSYPSIRYIHTPTPAPPVNCQPPSRLGPSAVSRKPSRRNIRNVHDFIAALQLWRLGRSTANRAGASMYLSMSILTRVPAPTNRAACRSSSGSCLGGGPVEATPPTHSLAPSRSACVHVHPVGMSPSSPLLHTYSYSYFYF